MAGRLIISVAPDEFYVAETGIVITFAPVDTNKKAGFIGMDEGRFENEKSVLPKTANTLKIRRIEEVICFMDGFNFWL